MKEPIKKKKREQIGSAGRSSLVRRVPQMIGVVVAIIIVIMCVAFGLLSRNAVAGLVDKEVQYAAGTNAMKAQSYFQSMEVYSEALADNVLSFQSFGRDTAQGVLVNSLKDVVSSGRVFSAYFAFEPNKFFADTPDGLSYYAYQNGGTIGVDILTNYAEYGSADYYAPAKSSHETHITEPYSYTLSSGETVWLITLSTPILDASGTFLGVANCDILSNSIGGIDYTDGGYQSAYTTLFTSQKTFVANTADPGLVGTQDTSADIDKVLSDVNKGVSSFPVKDLKSGKASVAVYLPVTLEGTDLNWTSSFVVNTSEVYRDVVRMVVIVAVVGLAGILAQVLFGQWILRRSLAPIAPLVKMAQKTGSFDLSEEETPYVFPHNEFGDLAAVFTQMAGKLKAIVQDEGYILSEMAGGNFTVQSRCKDEYVGAMHEILNSVQTIRDTLGASLVQISVSSDKVADSATQISEGSQTLAQGATEQASSIEELSSMINSINVGIRENAGSADQASKLSMEARTSVEESNEYMVQLTDAMGRIATASAQIQSVIKVIDDIAFQTNILALNAAVEAARAGESGKGFAVVADEVRNLAQKSAEAAKSTESLITTAVEAVEHGKSIAGSTAESLYQVADRVGKTNEMVRNISTSSQDQATAVEQITVGIDQISTVVQMNTATAEESAASSHELSQEAQKLKTMVGRFHLPS